MAHLPKVGSGSYSATCLVGELGPLIDRLHVVYPVQLGKVCNLVEMTDRQRDWLFKRTDVAEIWGVGRRIGKQLKDAGIATVLDLKQLDPGTVKRQWSVVMERTVHELNGIACIDLEHAPAPKQQIACTRSFGQKVTELQELEQAITEFASRAAHKLRGQDSQAGSVLVFIRTSPFRLQDRQYARSVTVPLRLPSSDTLRVVGAALTGLKRIFQPGYRYAKAGVMLLDLQPAGVVQQELDLGGHDIETERRHQRLMQALDAVNDRWGKGTLRLGSTRVCSDRVKEPQHGGWEMKQERRSPRYTTRWGEMLSVC